MTQGKRFLAAVIRDNAPARLAAFNETYFTEDELAVYNFVLEHKSRYGVLPDEEALRLAGHSLRQSNLVQPLNQPIEFYENHLRFRYIQNIVADNFTSVQAAIHNKDHESIVQLYRDALTSMGQAAGGESVTSYHEEAANAMSDYYRAKAVRGRLRGITLGWDTFDQLTMGAMPGDLIVFAGRPGVGKTTILCKAINAAYRLGSNGLLLTMEMSREAVTRRLIGIATGLNPNMLRAGELSRWGEQTLREHVEGSANGARLLVESGDATGDVDGIAEAVQRFSPDALYVDAAYLMSSSGRSKGYVSRWEDLSEVIRKLKKLAMKQSIPVFVTVQFNRNQKDRGDKAMDLSDIGGTDSIPQDASIVFGIKRAAEPYDKSRRIIQMLKNREGDVTQTTINYLFEPVNLEEVPQDEAETQNNDRPQQQAADMSWMER